MALLVVVLLVVPWLLNAASSFWRARRVLVRGLAHCVCVSAATAAVTGEAAFIALGLAEVALNTDPRSVAAGIVALAGGAVVPGIGEVIWPVAAAAAAAAAAVGSVESKSSSMWARSAIMCFNCCKRVQNCGLDLDSSLTASRKIELMARCRVIHERAACELIECISTYASTVFIRLFTQSARISEITGSVVLAGDLRAGLQISDAK